MKTFCLLLAISGVIIPEFIPERKYYTPEQLMQPYIDSQKNSSLEKSKATNVSPALAKHAIVTF